ncbi:MAG: DNA-binding protein [Mucilaginibacter sp.]|nr:DNA-binding protein [Mucilaginibacter sp.]
MTGEPVIPDEIIMNQIYYVRGHKVMLDTDLAELYEVETKQLKRQVRRNAERFPDDFMFELTLHEYNSLRSQIGTLKRGEHAKYLPMAFTEQGVSMLSSILNSSRAIKVNIQIIRIFTRIRQMFIDNTELRLEIEKIKGKLDNQDKNMEIVFRYLDELLEKKNDPKPRKRIGYKSDNL